MKDIKKLPQKIITKISAGQVVERPASVLKELLENALDAKSDTIDIQLSQGGLKTIKVTDNGEAMDKKNLAKSFLPHTTNKITQEEDLLAIKSLGFRGEALSSIASFAKMTIRSKQKNEAAGYEFVIKDSKTISQRPHGMPHGTQVIVNNLFSNTPARKKHLKKSRYEYRQCLLVMQSFALSHPEVAFSLMNNKKLVLDLPKQKKKERIRSLLGDSFFEYMYPIRIKKKHIKIQGYVSHPQASSTTQSKNFIFVNKRSVINKEITKRIKRAYGTILPTKAIPAFILSIDIPYSLVDSNIHPQKNEVKFTNEEMVYEMVKEAAIKTLQKNNFIYTYRIKNGKFVDQHLFQSLKDEESPWDMRDAVKGKGELFFISDVYILTKIKENLVLVDQHAAHERILFNQYLRAFKNFSTKKSIYKLQKPAVISVGKSDEEILNEYSKYFQKIGFDIDHFGDNSYKISQIPNVFKDRDIKALIFSMIDQIKEDETQHIDFDKRVAQTISLLACRSAIKEGERLTKKQAQDLIKKLITEKDYYTCPHGRPTIIRISRYELDRMFKRK